MIIRYLILYTLIFISCTPQVKPSLEEIHTIAPYNIPHLVHFPNLDSARMVLEKGEINSKDTGIFAVFRFEYFPSLSEIFRRD